MSAPWDLTATEIARRIGAGTLTATDLVASLLERTAEVEPEVLAWATLDADGATAEAHARDAAAAGDSTGPLRGVPVGIKDIIDAAGLPTIAGFEPFRDRIAERDATIVARLRAAGAVILGKTHTTQFAHGDPAPTRNPWNAERTPGGSSSGSAAAVAARMVPLAVGTQTAGSVLRPAAYCGVVAFKPTFNWVDRAGVLPLAWSLDHLGLFARTVEDVALAYGAVSGTAPDLAAAGASAPHVALLPEFLERAEPAVRDHLRAVAERLREAGAIVEERPLPVDLDLLLAVHHVIMAAEVAAVHAEALAADPASYGPNIRLTIEAGQLIPAAYVIKAQRLRRRIAGAVGAALAEVDAFLLPTASNAAPPRRTTGDRSFQAPWTMLGTPAITLPTGLTDDGLPLGSQLVGQRGGDARLLAVAAWCAGTLGLIAPPEIKLPEPEPVPEPEPEPEPVLTAEEPAAAEAGEPQVAEPQTMDGGTGEPVVEGAGEPGAVEPEPAGGEPEAAELPVEAATPEGEPGQPALETAGTDLSGAEVEPLARPAGLGEPAPEQALAEMPPEGAETGEQTTRPAEPAPPERHEPSEGD